MTRPWCSPDATLLAVDVPPMRRPFAHALAFTNRRIEKRANGRAERRTSSRR